MSAKVSIIMPVYNGARTIKRAILSLSHQTYTNWECIVINDGSTDNTLEVVKELQAKDERIQVISFDVNKGRPSARQKGLELADGEYLAMLDADDFYHSEKLEKQVALLSSNTKVSLVSSCIGYFGDDFDVLRFRPKINKSQVNYEYDSKSKVFPPHGASMLRLSLAKQFNYQINLKYGEDTDFLDKFLKKHKSYIILPEILYYYSAFDSISISDMKEAQLSRLKTTNSVFTKFLTYVKLCYITLVLPILGMRQEISRRGSKASKEQYLLFKRIKSEIEK